MNVNRCHCVLNLSDVSCCAQGMRVLGTLRCGNDDPSANSAAVSTGECISVLDFYVSWMQSRTWWVSDPFVFLTQWSRGIECVCCVQGALMRSRMDIRKDVQRRRREGRKWEKEREREKILIQFTSSSREWQENCMEFMFHPTSYFCMQDSVLAEPVACGLLRYEIVRNLWNTRARPVSEHLKSALTKCVTWLSTLKKKRKEKETPDILCFNVGVQAALQSPSPPPKLMSSEGQVMNCTLPRPIYKLQWHDQKAHVHEPPLEAPSKGQHIYSPGSHKVEGGHHLNSTIIAMGHSWFENKAVDLLFPCAESSSCIHSRFSSRIVALCCKLVMRCWKVSLDFWLWLNLIRMLGCYLRFHLFVAQLSVWINSLWEF